MEGSLWRIEKRRLKKAFYKNFRTCELSKTKGSHELSEKISTQYLQWLTTCAITGLAGKKSHAAEDKATQKGVLSL